MSDVISLCVPAKTKYISAARLAVSSACGDLDFDINKIDDLKSCIAESCLIIMCSMAHREVLINCEISRDIKVEICGKGKLENIADCHCDELNEEISKVMINSLADECEMQEDGGKTSRIIFKIKAGD